MYLSKLIILNNKSCKKIILEPAKAKPEVLIGINDCGKSTILQSLDVFFDEKKQLSFIKEDNQKNDLSNSPLSQKEFDEVFVNNNYPVFVESENLICVLCEFETEDGDFDNIEFQESSKNLQIKWAIGETRKLTILKVCTGVRHGGENKAGYYLLSTDYKDDDGNYLEAWSKNKTSLKEIREKLKIVDADVDNENGKGPFKNIEEIRAIYKKVNAKLEFKWSFYRDFSKDKALLPSFKYLDWNFSLRDLEELATEAMNEVITPLLKEIQDLALQKQSEALDGVNSKFGELMAGLKDELPKSIKNITSSIFFNVDKRVTDIKLEKEGSDGLIHLENQGDGIKRQIWFAILKWRSKVSVNNKTNRFIWCFDEPETHLYPSAQRQLFNTFKEMCESEYQLLLCTHSTVFIDRTQITNINKVSLDDGYSVINKTTCVDDIFDSIGLLNSDFLFFDKFLAVEGPTEFELIPSLYKLIYGRSLIEDGIQIINLKGKTQYENNKRILEEILSDFKKSQNKIFYLLDSDTGKVGHNIFTIGDFDIEDSIPNNIWIKYIKNNCNLDITDDLLNREIRNKITNDKKFYKLMSDYVALKAVDNKFIPSKGDSGVLLAKCFTNQSEIPQPIIDLFTAVNS